MGKVEDRLAKFWGSGAKGLLKHCLEIHKPSPQNPEWKGAGVYQPMSYLEKMMKEFDKYLIAEFMGKSFAKQAKAEMKEDKKRLKQIKKTITKMEKKDKGVPIK